MEWVVASIEPTLLYIAKQCLHRWLQTLKQCFYLNLTLSFYSDETVKIMLNIDNNVVLLEIDATV